MLQVLLADHRPLLHAGMSAVLSTTDDLHLLDTRGNEENLYHLCRAHVPDVLILNLNLPDLSLKEFLNFLQSMCAATRLLFLLENKHGEKYDLHKLLQPIGGAQYS